MNRDKNEFSRAKEQYAELGVDVDEALATLAAIPLSIHCWQGDDVGGFERPEASLSGGGIQVTGRYPGKARTIGELRADLDAVYALIPGRHRLSLHAIYGEFGGKKVDRDRIGPEHFTGWAEWAKARGIGLDFNATCFSHEKADSGFTLSSKDDAIRGFWMEHVARAREISAFLGRRLGSPCIHNLWIPDGTKDFPVDRMGHRGILQSSLDELYRKEYPKSEMKDAVESKLFGIGSEAYVVGSHEFYLGYAVSRGKIPTIDTGHFHPTELAADKISSILLFAGELLLHVSRPMRWDSDHVVILDDAIRLLSEEIVRSGRLSSIHIGLDFFDGTLNRIGAWVIGARAMLKGLLCALLEPRARLLAAEERGDLFERLALLEAVKSMPFGAVWDDYCARSNAPTEVETISRIHGYERTVLAARG